MKILLICSLLISSLFASIEFKETRYMAALDFDKERYGVLTITEETLILSYKKPSIEIITYSDTKITIQSEDDTKEYTFEEYPRAKYMGLILRTIINKNYDSLDNIFKVSKVEDLLLLKSLPIISDMVEYIEVQENINSKRIMTLFMSNKDKITIETSN